jgi:flagellar M-ring protein FliF
MNPFADLLRNLGPIRIAALIGTAVAVLGFFIFLATRLSSGGMTLLYGDLDIADSGSIIQKLDEQKILAPRRFKWNLNS